MTEREAFPAINERRSSEPPWWSILFYGADGLAYEAVWVQATGWHVFALGERRGEEGDA